MYNIQPITRHTPSVTLEQTASRQVAGPAVGWHARSKTTIGWSSFREQALDSFLQQRRLQTEKMRLAVPGSQTYMLFDHLHQKNPNANKQTRIVWGGAHTCLCFFYFFFLLGTSGKYTQCPLLVLVLLSTLLSSGVCTRTYSSVLLQLFML